jgi:hypothetical protein
MLKAGTIVLLVLFITCAAWSIVDIALPSFTLEGDFQAVTGGGYEGILGDGPLFIAKLYLRHMGVAAFAVSTGAIFILLGAFRKTERWAWWALLAMGVIVLGFGTAVNAVIANWFDFATHAAVLAWLLVGLLIPVKAFFGNKG